MTADGEETVYLRIDLDQEVVLSGTAASTGLHRTLGHIPGSVLLGLAAAAYQAIDDVDPELSWAVFHGGGVRFGNGVRLVDGVAFVPIPQVRQGDKDRKRDAFVSESGQYVRPEQNYRRRTAINPTTGRTLESALFGYSSLRAGQSFVSRVTFGPRCAHARDMILAPILSQPVWIGRSRGAEYGRVSVTRLDQSPQYPTHGDISGDRLRFYAVSDCAFPGGDYPDAASLGLPADWNFVPVSEHSALSWRRYAPFNGYRQAFDPERVVLAQGSVMEFRGKPLNPDAQDRLRRTLDQGIGLFVGEGLGVVLANPAVLEFRWNDDPKPSSGASGAAVQPDGPLFRWLSLRHDAWSIGDLARTEATRYEQDFARMYRILWDEGRLSGLSTNQAAPSRAQWGSVREASLRSTSLEDLVFRLFDASEGVCAAGTGAAPWQRDAPTLLMIGKAANAITLLKTIIDRTSLEQILEREHLSLAATGTLGRMIVAELAVQVPRIMNEVERRPA